MAYISLGSTPISTPKPEPGVVQPPVYPLIVGNYGGYMQVRSSPSEGACGVSTYPCKHPGVDVNGRQGTVVVAPENGTIEAIADGNSSPWVGYGPWLVLIKGSTTGRYHLLAHLDPSTKHMGQAGARVRAGDPVGTISHANHTHWEVRKKPIPDWRNGESNYENGEDPIAWLRRGGGIGFLPFVVVGGAGLLFALLYRRMR